MTREIRNTKENERLQPTLVNASTQSGKHKHAEDGFVLPVMLNMNEQ